MPPKKLSGSNTKAEEARSRKESAAREKQANEARAKEDAHWADEGGKSKASKKRDEDAARKAEAAQKRAEARQLAEKESQELEKSLHKASGKSAGASPSGAVRPKKVTVSELESIREKEKAELQEQIEKGKKKASRMADESEYCQLVDVENTNRLEVLVDARNLDEAVTQLSLLEERAGGGGAPIDKHPEKRMKAAFKAFEEDELPRLKLDRPGLTLTQYKDLLWKLWKKSTRNPLNQAAVDSAPTT